ncbi:MAG: DUF4491 family protein [Paludibacteraceae bacterium]|nr:DUF4491 family protein [Paludibacteraceae bacterium]
MNIEGIILGLSTFLLIGLFHPIVIKSEYYFGVGCWPVFLAVGIGGCVGSLLVDNTYISVLLGVFSFSCFWSILELFEQRERVRKGWFPSNPNRHESAKEKNE